MISLEMQISQNKNIGDRAIGGYREAVFLATETKFVATEKWTTIGRQPGLNHGGRFL
jgi:hypothetical protein